MEINTYIEDIFLLIKCKYSLYEEICKYISVFIQKCSEHKAVMNLYFKNN